ncbi:chemotaxis-specific protein-glutamate methyltransferase CheB [Modestobacter sp. I12A-02628]|uniref:Protein-glutamate methylesterase/protein-glutamine glutaminase n=1 Tax=Goekera deserti TaxID=2497753 RepID=A0A7K3WFG5_9ACTN|nr:chemotaxis response regulator protein-glutamate methylesterase [Goekera deserti]MPR00090.1 chemotaxis-specific protein-glutamate methyltransferase CheB [Goekera deserti]NDI49869.1 chemotaxis-specific protein-glutamate methyltransferase CheB [Goekera deserti]NEL55231.1 chemotaxis response regulator protein-glutamate methylesterase [Goekera deserti]
MNPIRVMVVDDSVVVRKIVTDVLSQDPMIEVVGTAANGRLAMAKIGGLKPDLVTMDIEMPEMNGIETVRAIRATRNRVPIIMFSTLTERGASATLDALSSGANDYVTKPANVGSVALSMESVREQLVPKIKALTGRPTGPGPGMAPPRPMAGPPREPQPRTGPRKDPSVLVIGSSTGGPEALTKLLPALPANLPVPVLLVQHMPPVFTRQFAQRLDRLCGFRVVEAVDGTPLAPGTVHLAPGDHHLTVRTNGRQKATQLNQGPPENFCRPAVDVLFRSAVTAFDGAVLGVVLTGMGSDGRIGTGLIREAGGSVIAQDQATSVVWGMPGAVTQAGFADQVLPIDRIAEAIMRHFTGSRSTGPAVLTGGAR